MKVLLISPPKIKPLSTDRPDFFEEEPQYYPPLSLMYIASYLKKYSPHSLEILDAQILKMDYDQIRQEIKDKSPQIVGITTSIETLTEVIEIAKIVKEINNSIHVTLEGTTTYIFFNETINSPYVDSLILGESEITFTELVNSLEQSPQNLSQIKGIVYKDKDQIIKTQQRELIFNLDALPYPIREMIPYSKYPFTTILGSRGCPYECIHCYRPPLSNNFRSRSSSNIVNEIEECLKLGIQEFIFVDEVATLNRKRIFDFCDEIIRRNLKIKFRIKTRVNNIDYSLLLKLREAGCHWIHYEVTTGTQKMLDFLKKEVTLKEIYSAVKLANHLRITNSVDVILGLPNETKEDMLKTIRFIKKINPYFAYFSICLPYPGTELYKIWLSRNEKKKAPVQEYALDPQVDFEIPNMHQNSSELTELLRFAYKSFYLGPGFVMKQLLTAPSFEVLKKRLRISLRVLNL